MRRALRIRQRQDDTPKGHELLLAAPFLVAGGCGACSSQPVDAGSDAAPDVQVSDAADAGPPCTPAPRPSYVPAGWIPYNDYAPCSGLYVPTDVSQLPTPITWQACEAAAGVAGCRRIMLDWTPLPFPTGTDADAVVDSNGNVVILTNRDFGYPKADHCVHLIAGPDGPVFSAIMATELTRFLTAGFLAPSFSPPRWALRVTENLQEQGGGYIGGAIDQVAPTTHHRFGPNAVHGAVAGDLGVLDIASNAVIGLLDFNTGSKLLDIKTPSLSMTFEWMFRSSVFWQGNSGTINDIGRWDQDAGAVDFINYGFDPTHAAGDLGTDGVDMVWLEGHGAETDAAPYTSMDYWTSPYATNSSMLQPHRLRSETTTAILGTPIAVGCGRAAYAPVGFVNGLRIVRLSDGWSWYLPNVKGWNWQQALALTCDEVFVRVYISGPITTMARVPFNQLGAGVPPD